MAQVQNDYKQELLEKVRENYLSVTLGILVFLVALTLIFRSGDAADKQADKQEDTSMMTKKTYVVQPGDSVSSIARDQLGSVDYADEIIAENKLTNPDQIEKGMRLVLPSVSEPTPTGSMAQPTGVMEEKGDLNGEGATVKQTISITGNTYTVKKGDRLWDIAERAYGDGEMYTRIIQANKLRNPDRLLEGTVLKLPRPTTK